MTVFPQQLIENDLATLAEADLTVDNVWRYYIA